MTNAYINFSRRSEWTKMSPGIVFSDDWGDTPNLKISSSAFFRPRSLGSLPIAASGITSLAACIDARVSIYVVSTTEYVIKLRASAHLMTLCRVFVSRRTAHCGQISPVSGSQHPRRPVLVLLSDQLLHNFDHVHPINAKVTRRLCCRILLLVTPENKEADSIGGLLENLLPN
jgi:hypothetical protein